MCDLYEEWINAKKKEAETFVQKYPGKDYTTTAARHMAIRLIRIIEKIEKNPEFSNKLGVKNTSDFISDKQQKMNHSQLDEC